MKGVTSGYISPDLLATQDPGYQHIIGASPAASRRVLQRYKTRAKSMGAELDSELYYAVSPCGRVVAHFVIFTVIVKSYQPLVEKKPGKAEKPKAPRKEGAGIRLLKLYRGTLRGKRVAVATTSIARLVSILGISTYETRKRFSIVSEISSVHYLPEAFGSPHSIIAIVDTTEEKEET